MAFFQLSLLRLIFFSIHFLVNPFAFFIHSQFLSFPFSFITFSFRLSLRTSMICYLSKAPLVLPWNYTKPIATQYDVKSQFKNKELDTLHFFFLIDQFIFTFAFFWIAHVTAWLPRHDCYHLYPQMPSWNLNSQFVLPKVVRPNHPFPS